MAGELSLASTSAQGIEVAATVAWQLKNELSIIITRLMSTFSEPPSPEVLQGLLGKPLSNRLGRALRLWMLLDCIYGEKDWAASLPQPFRYPDLRDRLFAPSHDPSETRPAAQLSQACQGTGCLCQRTGRELVLASPWAGSLVAWVAAVAGQTGWTTAQVEAQVAGCPFATVHRSLRQDLALLAARGWFQSQPRRGYICLPAGRWPRQQSKEGRVAGSLMAAVPWGEAWPVLEAAALVEPSLVVMLESLWEEGRQLGAESERRVFLELDYILTPEAQEQADDLQAQLAAFWQGGTAGAIQFRTWSARQRRLQEVTGYPVCLHYVRRAKYLTAYGCEAGEAPHWHNYRLDRVRSPRFRVLSWDNPGLPEALRELYQQGKLPTPGYVREQLAGAWGFDFYLPKALLVMRFPPEFALDYVDGTVRHPTFVPVAYGELPGLIEREVEDAAEREALLALVARRSPQDRYYQAWVRLGDINVVMRLRDWRPLGEVLAPLALREQMAREVAAERLHYDESLGTVSTLGSAQSLANNAGW